MKNLMTDIQCQQLSEKAIALLQTLISIPSFSKEEDSTAAAIEAFFQANSVQYTRSDNNVWAQNLYFDPLLPTILLNSHHDTVKPNTGYTRDPFLPAMEEGRLYGLGSNDAGGALVSLAATFLHFYRATDLRYNIKIALTAEEEISGSGGLEKVLPDLGLLDFALVGEPTGMNLAIAEKGLMVLDCIVRGKAGHAAREEGDNAIYKALPVLEWFRTYRFPKKSEIFGEVKMSVTIIQAGSQHNVVPESCKFTVDIRVTDVYTHEELMEIIRLESGAEILARSTRLKSSSIPKEHPVVQAGIALGRKTYGSPTTSDQSLLSIPSLKIGPGESARSHSADEYILTDEIRAGISIYIGMLEQVV